MFPITATAQRDLRAERQASLDFVLHTASAETVAQDRVACLTGEEAKSVPRARAIGARTVPDAADYCITVLSRTAGDGVRSLLRDAAATRPTSASALDNGFIVAYGRAEAIPPDLPMQAVLKPIAERCLAMSEPNIKLCYATGYAFGQRAYHGEVVIVR